MNLRKHQREIIEACREILEGKPIRKIILSVTPGGGKSFVPVIIAENLIPTIAEKICWVVPRNSLKYQGEGEFCDPRWNTDKRIRAADNGEDLARGFAGYVTTYQAVGQNPDCHAAEFEKHKYILFLDEVHHVAQGSEWHKALEPLVDSAVLVVLASGTLSRGDGQKIAFLDYYRLGDTGVCYSNTPWTRFIEYPRSAAIADGAILPIQFSLIDGEAEWEEMDGYRNTSALSGEESAKALFTALRTDFASQLMDAALFDFEQQITSGDYPEARMLVVAPNIEIAHVYKNYLERLGHIGNKLWGDRVQIATSEDTPAARRTIADFKRGICRILVTVAMAYEGLNVPEISVICCLSHIRSAPWLEQCFARANRKATKKYKAIVYAPADWAIKKAVRMIQQGQLVPLNNPAGQQELALQQKKGGSNEQAGNGGGERPWIIPINSRAETRVFTNPSRPYTPQEYINAATVQPDLPPWCSPSEAEKILRKNINGIISQFLDKQSPGNKQAHQKMLYRRMRLVCEKPVKDMNQDELEKVWLWVRKEYGLQSMRPYEGATGRFLGDRGEDAE